MKYIKRGKVYRFTILMIDLDRPKKSTLDKQKAAQRFRLRIKTKGKTHELAGQHLGKKQVKSR